MFPPHEDLHIILLFFFCNTFASVFHRTSVNVYGCLNGIEMYLILKICIINTFFIYYSYFSHPALSIPFNIIALWMLLANCSIVMYVCLVLVILIFNRTSGTIGSRISDLCDHVMSVLLHRKLTLFLYGWLRDWEVKTHAELMKWRCGGQWSASQNIVCGQCLQFLARVMHGDRLQTI